MLRLKFILVILCSFYAQFLVGQNLDGFTQLVARGELPIDMTRSKSDSYTAHTVSFPEVSKYELRLSTHWGAELMWTGQVLFGTELASYLQDVTEEILQEDQALFDKLRIYPTKGVSNKCLSMENGLILVPIELIAQLENEAQLAFFISRELARFKDPENFFDEKFYNQQLIVKRIRDLYAGPIRNQLGGSDLSMLDLDIKDSGLSDEDLLAILSLAEFPKFSKEGFDLNEDLEMEKEMDLAAVDLMKETGYNLTSLKHCIAVVQFQHLPFDEKKVDLTSFMVDTSAYEFASRAYKRELSESVETLAERKSESLEERSKALYEKLPRSEGSAYLISKDRFKACQTMSRFEVLNQMIGENQCVDAVYNAIILGNTHGDHPHLNRTVAKGLSQIFYKKLSLKDDQDDDSRALQVAGPRYTQISYDSEILSTYDLFESMSIEQVGFLCLKNLWNLDVKGQSFLGANELREEILIELINTCGFDYDMVYATEEPAIEQEETETQPASKYDQLKEIKKDKGIGEFRDLRKKINFDLLFNEFNNRADFEEYLSSESEPMMQPELPGSRLLILDPRATVLDKNKGVAFGKNSTNNAELRDAVKDVFSDYYDQVDLISLTAKEISTAEEMNQWIELKKWINYRPISGGGAFNPYYFEVLPYLKEHDIGLVSLVYFSQNQRFRKGNWIGSDAYWMVYDLDSENLPFGEYFSDTFDKINPADSIKKSIKKKLKSRNK